MRRKLRALGLAVISISAAGAVATAPAHAEDEFTASQYPATIEGQPPPGKTYKLEIGVHVVTCSDLNFKNTANSASKEITQTPTQAVLKDCTWVLMGMNLPAEVTMNGCDWVFPDPAKKDKELKCKSKPVEIHAFSSLKTQEEESPLCTYDVGEQTSGAVEFENKAGSPEDILVKESLTGLSYTVTGSKFLCGANGSNGEFSGETTLTAKNEAGSPIGFMIG